MVGSVVRVRSYSLSGQLGGTDNARGTPWDGQLLMLNNPGYPPKMKFTQINKPPPSVALAFVDESELSLDDGFYFIWLPRTNGAPNDMWGNLPALRRHNNNGTCFSFADGHAEIKKWRDLAILAQINNTFTPTKQNPPKDLQWLQMRSTAHK